MFIGIESRRSLLFMFVILDMRIYLPTVAVLLCVYCICYVVIICEVDGIFLHVIAISCLVNRDVSKV